MILSSSNSQSSGSRPALLFDWHFIHLRDSDYESKKSPSSPTGRTSGQGLVGMSGVRSGAVVAEIGIHADLRARKTCLKKPQLIFTKRDTTDQGGSSIITLDVVVLVLLLGTALAIAICEFTRRRKRKSPNDRPQQRLDADSSQPNALTENLDVTNQLSTLRESLERRSSYYSSLSDDMKILSPPAPPSSPTTPVIISPSTPISSGAMSGPADFPEAYRDPYPSPTRDMYRMGYPYGSSHPSTSRHPSFSSFFSLKAARSISRYARFSDTPYPDEPALSDARSAVLARTLSQSSSATVRVMRKNSHQSLPHSRRSEGDITVGGWYEASANAPAVPPLNFKEGDVQS